jgi:NAD(P)-dependent dehydrogenase (short-subunit alcohol dehydrogenase family)
MAQSYRINKMLGQLLPAQPASRQVGCNATAASGRFADQVAIVTGGAGGIGMGIALKLAQEGARVVITDISSEALKQAQAKLNTQGAKVHVMTVDGTKQSQVEAGVESIVKKYGRIDILVQSAGVTGKTGIKTQAVDPANFQWVMDINVNAIFLFCRAVLPHMVARNYGRIVNIASIAGKEGNAGMLAYSTSKAAVIGLTKALGKEYAETGITCNAVAPAVVRTAMVDAMPDAQVKYMTDKIPMKRCGKVEEISSLIAYIASPEAAFTTAFTWDATGGRATY